MFTLKVFVLISILENLINNLSFYNDLLKKQFSKIFYSFLLVFFVILFFSKVIALPEKSILVIIFFISSIQKNARLKF